MYKFEELEVWRTSRELRKSISNICKKFPSEEKYRLTDQIIRSSRSVHANIAEGFGRFHHQENIQFSRQARGSLFETKDHLICACDEGYISQTELSEFVLDIEKCLHKLNAYILYLKKAKQGIETK
jgi:four helix bundle protein